MKDQTTNADVVFGPVQRVTRLEMRNALKRMKLGKVVGPSEVNAEMIAASGKIGVRL